MDKSDSKKLKQPNSSQSADAQTASSLRLSEARLAGILASAMDAIITVDEDQRIVLFNAAAEKMFRCAAAEALGQSLDRFIPMRHRDAHRRHIEQFSKRQASRRATGDKRLPDTHQFNRGERGKKMGEFSPLGMVVVSGKGQVAG